MVKFGKWIGGGLGWALGGPIGGLVGFGVGALWDSATSSEDDGSTDTTYATRTRVRSTSPNDFAHSLLVLSAAVMKADGKHMKSELRYIRAFFAQNFGQARSAQLMKALQDLLQQDIPVRQVCMQIRANMQHSMRLQLLHYLFGIAQADGDVAAVELRVLQAMANDLGISTKDFASISAMFVPDTNAAYKILEIDPKASDAEVKKAYRKMAVKYHPDKVASLGEEFQKAAKDKFQKVQQAYEGIKKERGM